MQVVSSGATGTTGEQAAHLGVVTGTARRRGCCQGQRRTRGPGGCGQRPGRPGAECRFQGHLPSQTHDGCSWCMCEAAVAAVRLGAGVKEFGVPWGVVVAGAWCGKWAGVRGTLPQC